MNARVSGLARRSAIRTRFLALRVDAHIIAPR